MAFSSETSLQQRSIMPHANNKIVYLACGHAEKDGHPTNHAGKKFWQMLRWKSSRSACETSPKQCSSYGEDHHQERRKSESLARIERSTAPTPFRPTRCAPPARGVNQTLMAVMLGEDETSVQALKVAQRTSQHQAINSRVSQKTKRQQELELEQTLQEITRAEGFWREVHEIHKGLNPFDPARPFKSLAGPRECQLCKAHRDTLVDSRIRRTDHLVRDAFDPEISLDDFKEMPSARERLSSRWELKVEQKVEPSGSVRNKNLRHPKPRVLRPLLTRSLDKSARWLEENSFMESDKDHELRLQGGEAGFQLWTPHASQPTRSPNPEDLWRSTTPQSRPISD